jgi:hypothetical protein
MKSYSIGERVSQPQYGSGTITMVNEYHTIIDFDEHGSRTFATPMVQLGRCDTSAPVRVKRARRRASPAVAKP